MTIIFSNYNIFNKVASLWHVLHIDEKTLPTLILHKPTKTIDIIIKKNMWVSN